MTSILHTQAETFARSVDGLLMEDHRWAMKCRDAEGAVRVGLALFDAFEGADASWREAVRRASGEDAEMLLQTGAALREISAILHSARARTLELIRQVESRGYRVDGVARYRDAVHAPFDERRLEVPIASEDVAAFVGAAGRASDLPDDADDDL
jgi:hypothetical protein